MLDIKENKIVVAVTELSKYQERKGELERLGTGGEKGESRSVYLQWV